MFRAFRHRYLIGHRPFLLSRGLAAAGLVCLGMSATARATLVITLTNGASTVTVTDGEIAPNLDQSAATGTIVYSGAVGAFLTTITVASSNSPGSPALAKLNVTSIDGFNTAGSQQQLVVTVSDVNFAQPNGPVALQSTYSGSFNNAQAGDSTSFQSFVDPTNSLAEPPSLSTLQSFNLSTAVLQSISDTSAPLPFSAPGNYSITDVTTITVAAGATWQVSGITNVTPLSGGDTPEPATLALLAPASLLLMARRLRRIARN